MKQKHEHEVVETVVRVYADCVNVRDCAPWCHGGVTEIETCWCGARRSINKNAGREEPGTWSVR